MTPGLTQWLWLAPIALACYAACAWSVVTACRKSTPAPKRSVLRYDPNRYDAHDPMPRKR